jgi:hypothetical protein
MAHARWLSISLGLSIAVALAGCGGGSTARDAGSTGNDAANPGDDAATPGVDAAGPGVDAASPGVDAASDNDAATSDVDAATAGSGACTNSADTDVLAAGNVTMVVSDCAMSSLGAEPGTRNCIESMSGLTMACADCFDGEVHCSVMHCALACAGGESPGCASCRATNCDPAFQACSGLAP